MSKSDGPDVVVGDFVQWFAGARSDAPPFAALVVQKHHNGMVNLLVYNQDGFGQLKIGIWPMGSQILKDNPPLAAKNGAWEFRRPAKESTNHMATVTIGSAEPPEQPPFDGGKPPLKKKDAAQTASA